MDNIFPEKINSEAVRLFGLPVINEAKKLIQLSRVTLSFSKGTPETYLIVSGIIRQDRSHEAKITYKKRLEGTEEGPVKTNCDCVFWSKEKHCQHTAALYVTYLMHLSNEKNLVENDSSVPPVPIQASLGVNVYEYGTLLKGPHQLQGSRRGPTYTSMQYLLHNKKIINFPVPERLEGKIIINLTSSNYLNEQTGLVENLPMCRFAFLNSENKVVKEISLFENLYLFNWKTGEAFHLTRELKDLIQKIKIYTPNILIDDYFRYIKESNATDQIVLNIDNVNFEDLKQNEITYKVHLNKGEKRGQIQVSLFFHDEEENVITPPDFFKIFCFTSGYLSSFAKKKEAYLFIEKLSDFIEEQDSSYKQELIISRQKNKINSILDYTLKNDNNLHYEPITKKLYTFDNSILLKIFNNMYKCFGELFFRYSSYFEEEKIINFQASSATLFEGLSKFYSTLNPLGIDVFYNRQEISRWSSRVKFERRETSTKWFDLELNMSNLDLEIIKNADLSSGIVVTETNMIMLTKEQKTLLKFLKKYTKYEASEKQTTKLKGERQHTFVLPFNRARIFELFELRKMGLEGALTEEEIKICNSLATLEEIPSYDIPGNLDSILRPYQKTGFNWLSFLYKHKLGACLADDMGLGKTLQTICFIQSIYDKIDRVLIVCPVTILINWQREFEKFSNIDVCIYHGTDRSNNFDKKIILTSYGVMKKEAEDTFKDINFDVFVLDEVQHLKNIRSMGAFAARQINADFKICLTGTPVENDLSEFFNIIDLCVPGIWGDLQFVRTTSTKKSRLLARNNAKPFILRRTKSQVLTELPPKIENNVYLELSDYEREQYKKSLVNIRKRILQSQSRKKYGEILKGLLELRQKCLWQLDENSVDFPRENLNSVKLKFLVEQLEQIVQEGHQVIIFSQFTKYLDKIENIIRDHHWKMVRIDGSQSAKKRHAQVDLFQEGKCPIFLISLKAGGVGLNLTNASYVFLMDPWWNPAVENQAIDRAHRIGQKNTLTVYRPIIKDSVEEKVLELQKFKKQLFAELLPENEGELFTGKLSMNDFQSLLEL